MKKSWSYGGAFEDFLNNTDAVSTALAREGKNYCVLKTQNQAWLKEVEMLKTVLPEFNSNSRIYFEYNIPRMAKRVDVILLINGILFVLEYKVDLTDSSEDGTFASSDCEQVSDYAHEFSYFHSTSHFCPIVPILIDTGANEGNETIDFEIDDYNVYKVLRCSSGKRLIKIISAALKEMPAENRVQDYSIWENGVYEPTPTIVEVAESLYANHSVEEITRSGVGAQGIINATTTINAIIEDAHKNNKKVICFLTGVPGAGKTLVGINLVSSRESTGANRVFLSGNYPLVTVLQAALVEDRVNMVELVKSRLRAGESLTEYQEGIISGSNIKVAPKPKRDGTFAVTGSVKKGTIERQVKTKIQLVPNFREGFDLNALAPNEHVFVFDEAQRAWSAERLKTKENRTDGMSEPDILLSYLDRHQDWCVAIALVGNGQDIHDGEAGIIEWYKALATKFSNWEIYVAHGEECEEFTQMQKIHQNTLNIEKSLHLKHPMRSFRAQQISDFIESILNGHTSVEEAKRLLGELSVKGEDGRIRFPIYVTRDLNAAKGKIKLMVRGRERYGLLVSSKAKRLRHYGVIAPDRDFDEVAWFLDGKKSINSSYSMEVAASEFKVQGLEIDYSLVGWDADLKYDEKLGQFVCRTFSISECAWKKIEGKDSEIKSRHLVNAYRVILTRARQGMVIFIPKGIISEDASGLDPKNYDPTYKFLHDEIGIPDLDD